MNTKNIIFPCGDLNLEGLFYSAAAAAPVPAVVVCHPHPQYGGSMHNNVTYAIASQLIANGISALLFNFRGVEGSQGQYGEGIAEQDDIRAALDWLEKQAEIDCKRLGLAGYSFGAYVSLPVACSDPRIRGAAFISPFWDSAHLSLADSCAVPSLLISGSRDNFVNPGTVSACHAKNPHQSSLQLIEGADHFWAGYEKKMAVAVAEFFLGLFKQ